MDADRLAFAEMTFPGYFAFAVMKEDFRQEYIDDTGDQIPDPITDPKGVYEWTERFEAWSKKHYISGFEGE